MDYREAITWLRQRKRAYQLTFGNNRIVTSVRAAYRVCFGNYAGNIVMADLVRYCRGVETCVVAERGKPVDRERTLILEGRREVLLRINEHLRYTSEQLYALYDGKSIQPATDDDEDS